LPTILFVYTDFRHWHEACNNRTYFTRYARSGPPPESEQEGRLAFATAWSSFAAALVLFRRGCGTLLGARFRSFATITLT
jgi:hypothetical protein